MQAKQLLAASRATLLMVGALWVLASVAPAGMTFDYSYQPRTFRACRLLVHGQPGDADPVSFNYRAPGVGMPHSLIFEGLRRFPDKPAGWDIENPLAPPAIIAGQPNVTKSNPAYWEVPLNAVTAPQLENFDVIYIFAGGINFQWPVFRDTMLRAVHEGAVVWIDQPTNDGSGFTGTNIQAFAPPGDVTGAAVPPFTMAAATQQSGSYRRAEDYDMLFTYPFPMRDLDDVQFLGLWPAVGNANFPAPPAALNESADPSFVTCNDPGLFRVASVWDPGANAWLPNVVVYRYGAGAVLITASNVGHDLVDWWLQRDPPPGRPRAWEAPECKFGWNVFALTSAWPEARQSNSQRSYSQASIGLPLDIKWQYPDRFEPITANVLGSVVGSPVVSGGLVYALSLATQGRDPMLLCFDKDPAQDLDLDGRADDGVPDYARGLSYDLVGSTSLGADWTTRGSSPTLTTLSGLLGGGAKLQVALVSVTRRNPGGHSEGYVRCYNATFDPRVLAEVPANDINGNGLGVAFRTPGALIWEKMIDSYDGPAGGANGQVIELSTPAVYKDYVYVLSSEVDEDADGNGGLSDQDAYGRAHCFQLNYRWDLNPNGPQWSYPEITDNPNGDSDVASAGGAPDDNAFVESPKLFPPFQPPAWVAGVVDGANDYDPRPEIPPLPTQKPVLDQPVQPRNDTYVDAYLHFTSPTSVVNNAGVLQTVVDHRGSDYCVIPTPKPIMAAPYTDTMNEHCWLIHLPQGVAGQTAITSIVRADDPDIDCSATIYEAGTTVYAELNSAEVREISLPSRTAPSPWGDPLTTSRWVNVVVNYTVSGAPMTPVTRTISGLIRQRNKYPAEWQRVASRAVENGYGYQTFDTAEDDNGDLPAAGDRGYIESRRQDNGNLGWRFRPGYALPDPVSPSGEERQLLGKPGMALDRMTETAYAAVTMATNPDAAYIRAAAPQVLGLNIKPRLQVQLLGGGPDTRLRADPAPPSVQTIFNGALVAVPASAYTSDDDSRTISFDIGQAAWIPGVGPLWGKPIWVTYSYSDPPNHTSTTTVSDELHVLPDILRFQYTPGYVRLNHTVVRAANVVVELPNGAPLAGVSFAEPIYPAAVVPAGADPAWPEGFLAQGLLNVDALQMPGGEPLRPGSDIQISYEYWDPVLDAPLVVTKERHQIPLYFGESISSPVVAGATLHVGTEGFHPTRVKNPAAGPVGLENSDYHNPGHPTGPILAPNGGRRSLLSVLWDPISRVTRGVLSQTAYPEAATYGLSSGVDQGVPVTTASPGMDGNTLFVGSRMMTQLSRVASYQGQGLGFVSALESQRTLISDASRLIEVTGQTPSWVCVGSLAPDYHASYQLATQGTEELKPTPFSRPAKAIYLKNGHILVADSGNNRVIEIDRQGRQVWPLDQYGYDYYTSPYNTKLSLDRPADVYRYYVTDNAGVTMNSPNGDLLPGTISHTIVADPGNYRVVDIITTVNPLGEQSHIVLNLTPDFTRVGTRDGLMRIAYTKAQPIFRPDDGLLAGYLCAASNLHQLVVVEAGSKRVNPPGTNAPVAGTFDWNWWAWLYDSDLTDALLAPDDPLIFRNIRHVEFTREDDFIYLTVTCGQYAGRARMVADGRPHVLAQEGAGVFEFAINVSGAPGTWALEPAVDIASGTVLPDDPIWRFTTLNYTFSDPATNLRRYLTNLRYTDADGVERWLPMGWDPVAAKRLPGDLRPTGAGERIQRHLITNYAELIQNLNRANANTSVAPASLFSSVFAVNSDDRNNNDPNDDLHDIDRREVVPDPNELDWPDPFNQPTYAERH